MFEIPRVGENINVEEAMERARDRREWRTFVITMVGEDLTSMLLQK